MEGGTSDAELHVPRGPRYGQRPVGPGHTTVDVRAVDTFPSEGNRCVVPPCFLCCKKGKRGEFLQCSNVGCSLFVHLSYAGPDIVVGADTTCSLCLRPASGRCPLCAEELFLPLRTDQSRKRKRAPAAGKGFVALGLEGVIPTDIHEHQSGPPVDATPPIAASCRPASPTTASPPSSASSSWWPLPCASLTRCDGMFPVAT